MKHSELKQLIKEEIKKVLNENQPKSKKDLGPKYKKGDKIEFFYYAGENPGDSQEGVIDRDPRPSRHPRKDGWEYSVYGLSNWIHEDDISHDYTRIIQKSLDENQPKPKKDDSKTLNEWFNKPDSYKQGFSRIISQLEGILNGDVRSRSTEESAYIQLKRDEIRHIIMKLEMLMSSMR